MAKSKNSRLEIVVAIGTVVFMFLFVGILNIGDTNPINQAVAPETSLGEDSDASSEVSNLEPVELRPAISEFTVMDG